MAGETGMKGDRRRFLKTVGLGAPLSMVLRSAVAESAYPSRRVNLVVANSAGGAADRVARLVANRLKDMWNQQVVIDNRTGASGMIGAEYVARSAPDGYTLLYASGTFVQAPALFPNAPYHPLQDFTAVSLVCTLGIVFVVSAASDIKSLQDFVAKARQAADKPLSYGSVGTGSSLHLYGEILSRDAKVNLRHVPYKGEAQVLTDIVGGHIDSGFVSMSSGLGLVQSGKVRPLGVVGQARSPTLPDVPTFPEAGYPGLDLVGWHGLVVPKNTPSEIAAKIGKDIASVVQDPEIAAQITAMGFAPKATSSEEYEKILQDDFKKWKKIVEETGVKPE